MTKTAQHLSIIMLIGVMLALVGYGGVVSTAAPFQATQEVTQAAGQATSQAANLPAPRPIVRVDLNGTLTEGTPASYCWPSPDTSQQCDFIEEVQPDNPLTVAEGTDLKFQLDPASPAPQEFRATFPDDTSADGNPVRVDLAQSGGAYKVEGLSTGAHHVLVEAFYPGESAESQFFVSYMFLLQVGSVSVALATETGTQAVPVATIAPPTSQPTAPVVTEAAQPTEVSPTEVPPTVILPTEVSPTEVSATEVSATEVSPTIAPPTPVPPTPIPPTEVPPTPVPPTPVPPTEVPPTVVAVAPTASSAPGLIIIAAGRTYDPVAINACVLGTDGSQTCVTRPFNAAAERIFAALGDTAQVAFKGPRPTTINVSVLSADAITVISKQSVPPDNLALYTLPASAGNYVLAVDIVWPAGKATYYYRLTVNS